MHSFHLTPVVLFSNMLVFDVFGFYQLGSFQCRVGWATDEKPRLTFKNITARPKAKKLMVIICFWLFAYASISSICNVLFD